MSILTALSTPVKRKRDLDGDMTEETSTKRRAILKDLGQMIKMPLRLFRSKHSATSTEGQITQQSPAQPQKSRQHAPGTAPVARPHNYELPGSFPEATESSQEDGDRHEEMKAQHRSPTDLRRAQGDRNTAEYWRGVEKDITRQAKDGNVSSKLDPALQSLGPPPPFSAPSRKVPTKSRPLHQSKGLRPGGALHSSSVRQRLASSSRKEPLGPRKDVGTSVDDIDDAAVEQIRKFFIDNNFEGYEYLSDDLRRSSKLATKVKQWQENKELREHLQDAERTFWRRKEEEAARKLRPKTPEKPRPLVTPLAPDVLNSLPNLAKINDSQQLGMFGRTPVTARDLQTLRNGVWLNDEIINSWLWELCDKAKTVLARQMEANGTPIKDDTPRYHAFNTQWYPTMQAPDWRNKVPRWAKRAKVDGANVLKVHKILIPIHHGAHWTLLVILPQRRTVRYYDSLAGSAAGYLQAATDWLSHELGDKWTESEWRVEQADSGHQVNMSDCGVFLSLNALATFYSDALPEILPTGELSSGRNLMKYILINGGFKDDYELQKLHPSFRLEEDRQVNGEARKVGKEVVKAN